MASRTETLRRPGSCSHAADALEALLPIVEELAHEDNAYPLEEPLVCGELKWINKLMQRAREALK